jgi:phosphate-selective porin OprO/OprP
MSVRFSMQLDPSREIRLIPVVVRNAPAFVPALVVLLAASVALAQTPPTAASAAPAPASPASAPPPPPSVPATPAALVTAGWQNGFVLQSSDGDYRLQLGALVQTDGRFSVDNPLPITNTFTLRKARISLAGRLAKYFDFRLMPDFGNGATTLQEAYLDLRFSSKLRIRTGKDKTPVGYELLTGDAGLLFPERSLASSLVPNRDVGVQAQGDLAGGRIAYAGGLFNGVADGTSSTTDLDVNNDKDLAGRIVVQPFRGAEATRPFSGLGFHLGASRGTQSGAVPSFKTSIGQTYFSYASAAASGERTRFTPAVFYYYKSLGAFGEYVRSTQSMAKNTVSHDIANHAWDVSGSFLITGERASPAVPTPTRRFDPGGGSWGAVQVVARYAELTIDNAAFTAGLAAEGASRRAQAFTVGVNWYPTAFVKYYATFERTVFDHRADGPRPAEDAILFRVQVAF